MPYFFSPKVIYGKGALKRLSAELEGKGSRAAIITDRTLRRNAPNWLKASGQRDMRSNLDGWKPTPPGYRPCGKPVSP